MRRIKWGFVCVALVGSSCTGDVATESPTSSGVTEQRPTAEEITVIVDEGLTPVNQELSPFEDGGAPRPVATTTFDGAPTGEFVTNELLITTNDDAELRAFVDRWDGTVLMSIEPPESAEPSPTRHLVRIDTERADADDLADLLNELATRGGELRVSTEEGAALIAAAAQEHNSGLRIDINWIMQPSDLGDRVSDEQPDTAGAFRNAFNFSYMTDGSNLQDTGVGEAWVALERAGALSNTVSIAIIDGGFAPNADFPVSVQSFSTSPWMQAQNSPNPTNCSGGTSCPWHGTGAVGAAVGLPDNGYGGVGPAGPVATLVTVHTELDHGMIMSALGIVASRASIISMSFGGEYSTYWAWWTIEGYADFVKQVFRNGNIMFAAAGNGDDNGVGFDIDAGETAFDDPSIMVPCEFVGVICVGALVTGSDARIGYSNFGGASFDSEYSNGTVDIFGPTNILVGEYPSNPGVTNNFNGTSASTPFVAGVAALIKAADPSLSAFEVTGILLSTAHTAGSDPQVNSWVDALAAVLAALPDDNPPVLVVDTPTAGAAFQEGDQVPLQATVDDLDTAPSEYLITWSYQRDGTAIVLGNSASGIPLPTDTLCDGTYSISATALHPTSGATASATVDVTIGDRGADDPPPQCDISISIDAPGQGQKYAVGDTIVLTAAIDDDHPENADPLYAIEWRSDGPGGMILGSGLTSSAKLGPGVHTIYVSYGSASDQVTIEVEAGNPPTAEILNPTSGDTFSDTDFDIDLTFTGQASDLEDGVLSGASLVWSYRESATTQWFDAGTGTETTINFRPFCDWNSYDVKLTVTDSGGFVADDTITVLIHEPPC